MERVGERTPLIHIQARLRSLAWLVSAWLWLALLLVAPAFARSALIEITNRADAQFLASPGHTNFVLSGSVSVLVDALAAPDPVLGLFIEKVASHQTVEIGEFLDYTLRVRNVSSNALTTITVTDLLPAGFAYVRGTARFNGVDDNHARESGRSRLREDVDGLRARRGDRRGRRAHAPRRRR